MKKINLILSILFACTFSYSQSYVRCQVIDKENKENLPSANVYVLKHSIGTTTDSEGFFQLCIDNFEQRDSIIISYLGYQKKILTIGDLQKKNQINLCPIVKELEQIEIKSKRKKIKIRKIALQAIRNYHKMRPSFTHLASCQAAEYIRIDSAYCFYMESLGYAIYGGKKISTNPLLNFKFFSRNTALADCNSRVIKKIREKEEQYDELESGLGVGLRSLQLLNHYGVLDSIKAKKYHFELDTIIQNHGEYSYSISFNKGKKKGKFLLNRANLQFVSLQQETNDCWSTVLHKNKKGKVYFSFNYFEGRPYFSSIKNSYRTKEVEHCTIILNKYQKASHFFLADEIHLLNTYDSYPYVSYDNKEWKHFSSLFHDILPKIESDLKKISKKKLTLENQFRDNSKQWLVSDYNYSGARGIEAIEFINDLTIDLK